ncbi:MAG: hypothetical protein ACQESK_04650 [Bacteroidota bacterium]
MKFKFYTILAVICLLFPSCNSDDDLGTQNIVEKSNNRDQAYEVIDESRLSSKIPTIYNQLKEVNNISINSQEHSPLEVILDEVNMIEHDSITTYTFQVVNYDHFGSVPAENLIYTKYYNGDGFFSLLRYDLRKSDYPSVIDGSFQDLDNFVGLVGYTRELDVNTYLYESFSTTLPGSPDSGSECFTFVNANTEMCPENIHTFTEVENGKCKVADPGDLGPPVYEVITDLNCLESGGSSGGDGDGSGGNPGDGNPDGSMFPDPSYSGYAPGGGGFEDPGDGDPGDGSNYTLPGLADANGFSTTYPNLSFEYNAFYDFYTGLDAATQQIFNNFSYDTKNEIQDFLEGEDYSSDAVDFIMEVIEVLNENPDFSPDFELSYKSPYNIDLTNVTPDETNPEPEKERFIEVYEAVTESSMFKNMIQQTFDENERLNVKFEIIENLSSSNTNDPAHGKAILHMGTLNETEGNEAVDITIQINKNSLVGSNSVSKIAIAKTIMHEFIHAYIYIKLINANLGASLEDLNNNDLAESLNDYNVALDGNSAAAQHEFMFDKMVPTLSNNLAQILNLLVPQNHQAGASEYNFEGTQTEVEDPRDETNFVDITLPDTPWNWNEFYYYFSLGGLQNTDAFYNSIWLSEGHMLYGKYIKYIGLGNNLFN